MNTRMKQSQNRKPAQWQCDANQITTSKVQFWCDGTMLTAQMDKLTAQARVSAGLAFVISAQAIGALDINGNMDS